MAEKKTTPEEKPQEILDIERNFGVLLQRTPYQPMTTLDYPVGKSYSLNDTGQVISLQIDGVKIEDFSLIGKSTFLKQLSLSNCIISDINWMHSLLGLEELSFYESKVYDYSQLYLLDQLRVLWIVRDKVPNIHLLAKLKKMNHLVIQHVALDDISFVENLIELKDLKFGENGLSDISPIKNLVNLISFCAWQNKIVNIDSLKELKLLESVFLQTNKIENVEVLTFLPNLNAIIIADNQISDIPAELFSAHPTLTIGNINEASKNTIAFELNPLTSPPYSVIELGMPAVKAYFENKKKHGAKPLNEGRIILVGDGSAGKSSIMDRILYNSFDEHKPQTDGIKIEQWHLQKEARDLRFNMWDFGGQEVQHAVHKFFFTSGCLYILVLDNRKEEEPEYWLQQIETLGGKAPVLVVFNKVDQNLTENFSRKFLKDKYPNIVAFFSVSCKKGTGIQEFQSVLEQEASKLSTVDDQFPGNWFEIKKELEASTGESRHYLVYDAYVEKCKEHGVTDEETQKLLLKYFSFIGTVTWFGDSSAYLSHMHVLNPAWITQGVYRIVTGKKTEYLKGQIQINDFKELLQPTGPTDFEYNESHYGYILGLMKKFELCYTADEINILVPARFSKEPKIEYNEFKGEDVRAYILQFKDYLPVAIIHQFIVRNITNAFEKNYWYEGIVIQDLDEQTLAMVQLDREAKRVYVRIKGDNRLALWSHIREDFGTITKRYANLPYSEQVAIHENDVNNVVDYKDLVNHLKAKKSTYFHPKLIRDFDVLPLIGWFEPVEKTIEKAESGRLSIAEDGRNVPEGKQIVIYLQQLINNSNQNNNQINVDVEVNIDIQLVNNLTKELKEETSYLLGEIKEQNKGLADALQKALDFANEAAKAKSQEELQGKGWGRKLKQVMEAVKLGSEFLKSIPEGGEAAHKILHALTELAQHFHIVLPGIS